MAVTEAQRKTRPGVAQQRRSILEAAVGLFASAGTATVSVSAICKAAGVSRDTFYRCFDDKEALIDLLYQNSVSTPMLAVVTAADADFTDINWLRPTVSTTVDAILEQHVIARFFFLEAADLNSHAHQVIEEAFDAVARSMQQWCRERYGYSPSRLCFTSLLSAAQWLVHGAINAGMAQSDVRRAKRAIEELFLATFRGLAPLK